MFKSILTDTNRMKYTHIYLVTDDLNLEATSLILLEIDQTRKTRMPAFWGYPLSPHDYPYYWPVHIGSQVKTRHSQSYKFKEFAKTSNLLTFIKTLHWTHLLKLLDKMCKYELDPASILEDTERTRFCPQMDRRREGRTDGQGETSIPPFNFVERGV